MRRLAFALAFAFALAGSLAPARAASAAGGDDAEARAIAEARAARGRWCPIGGCAPAAGSLSGLGGFAVATLGALAFGRRRSA